MCSLLLISSLLTSCSIGIKEKTIIVFSSPYKTKLENGLVKIAQNKKIRVVVKTKDGQYVVKTDLGGMYVLSESQFLAIKKRLANVENGSGE